MDSREELSAEVRVLEQVLKGLRSEYEAHLPGTHPSNAKVLAIIASVEQMRDDRALRLAKQHA